MYFSQALFSQRLTSRIPHGRTQPCRRSLKFAAKDFELAFDDSHYPQTESVKWLDAIIERVWYNHPVTLAKIITANVQPILDANCPPPLVCCVHVSPHPFKCHSALSLSFDRIVPLRLV